MTNSLKAFLTSLIVFASFRPRAVYRVLGNYGTIPIALANYLLTGLTLSYAMVVKVPRISIAVFGVYCYPLI